MIRQESFFDWVALCVLASVEFHLGWNCLWTCAMRNRCDWFQVQRNSMEWSLHQNITHGPWIRKMTIRTDHQWIITRNYGAISVRCSLVSISNFNWLHGWVGSFNEGTFKVSRCHPLEPVLHWRCHYSFSILWKFPAQHVHAIIVFAIFARCPRCQDVPGQVLIFVAPYSFILDTCPYTCTSKPL